MKGLAQIMGLGLIILGVLLVASGLGIIHILPMSVSGKTITKTVTVEHKSLESIYIGKFGLPVKIVVDVDLYCPDSGYWVDKWGNTFSCRYGCTLSISVNNENKPRDALPIIRYGDYKYPDILPGKHRIVRYLYYDGGTMYVLDHKGHVIYKYGHGHGLNSISYVFIWMYGCKQGTITIQVTEIRKLPFPPPTSNTYEEKTHTYTPPTPTTTIPKETSNTENIQYNNIENNIETSILPPELQIVMGSIMIVMGYITWRRKI